MSKKVILVGHCGPDSSYLRIAIRQAAPDAVVLSADTQQELDLVLTQGASLVLINRVLGFGFDSTEGVNLIRHLKATHPAVKTMLISNYPSAQSSAVAAGALPGFGKSELSTENARRMLRDALSPAGTPTEPAH